MWNIKTYEQMNTIKQRQIHIYNEQMGEGRGSETGEGN